MVKHDELVRRNSHEGKSDYLGELSRLLNFKVLYRKPNESNEDYQNRLLIIFMITALVILMKIAIG